MFQIFDAFFENTKTEFDAEITLGIDVAIPKYFSKRFQKKFGVTPTQFANEFSGY
ncbi:hypothetical protein [Flavivirga jejuensis]|uniref:HTH araC/xylS-type domain-containing protein n=1 Tax=Flavivirga jejuensis TaxID=870487 RepID=A0ABT8WJW0_9FLAO|nr:hypothetical protein [Flavivirga jejuensis]MDO5973413.1 hypothetical protein [Flavivirga jejuensis]